MASNPRETVWKAEPHTIAKIEILRSYLNAYFAILGTSRRDQSILCVDGFCGPGEYSNYPEGSPLAALTSVANAIHQTGSRWIARDVAFVFIDDNEDRCDHLKGLLAKRQAVPGTSYEVLNATFASGLAKVRSAHPSAFTTNQPLFVFIDPFGATGVPFSAVAEILRAPCSEVLINLDADGIGRILLAEDHANHAAHLRELFGDESWRSALTAQGISLLCKQVLELYKLRLKSLPEVEYVFSFEMRGASDLLNYFLVFASRHPLGLKRMKEAMGKIDRSGRYCFSDGAIGQEMMFRFDKPDDFAPILHAKFRGSVQLRATIEKYTLNETPFTNPQKMLASLEKQGLIEVAAMSEKRKRGDFSENAVRSVKFLDKNPKSTMTQSGLFDGNQV